MQTERPTTKVLVCHQGQLSGAENLGPIFTPLNLDEVELRDPYRRLGPRLAEVRAFPSVSANDSASRVGFLSWRMPEKLAFRPTWKQTAHTIASIPSDIGFAPYLWSLPISSLVTQVNGSFPGMGDLVMRLQSEHPPVFDSPYQVGGNSFVVPLEAFVRLRSFTEEVLTWSVWERQPCFKYRCRACGHESMDGIGRYAKDRDVGMFIEVSTIYFFATQVDLEFRTFPEAIVKSSPQYWIERLKARYLRTAKTSACSH